MRPSIKTVAALAGVSPTAVSLCLNDHPTARTIPAATRARIMRAVEASGYRPHFLAQALSRGRTDSIGLVVADLKIERQANYASEIMELAEARGQSLLISATRFSKELELQCLLGLKARRVDGVVFQFNSLDPDTEAYRECVRDRFPVVKLSRDPYFRHVVPNSRDAMLAAVARFRELGFRRLVGIITMSEDDRHYHSFIDACREAGMEYRLVPPDRGQAANSYSDGLLAQLASEPEVGFVVLDVYNLARLLRRVEGRERIVTFMDEFDACIDLPDERFVGVIHSNYRRILVDAVDLLVDWIRNPDGEGPLCTEVPATFVSMPEFKRLTDYEGRWQRRHF